MKNIQRYTIEHLPTSAGLTVEINFDFIWENKKERFTMMQMIRSMVDFFKRPGMFDSNEKYLDAFLKQITEIAMSISSQRNCTLNDLIKEIGNLEGYWKVDGSEGIRVIDFCKLRLDNSIDYQVTKLDSFSYFSPSHN